MRDVSTFFRTVFRNRARCPSKTREEMHGPQGRGWAKRDRGKARARKRPPPWLPWSKRRQKEQKAAQQERLVAAATGAARRGGRAPRPARVGPGKGPITSLESGGARANEGPCPGRPGKGAKTRFESAPRARLVLLLWLLMLAVTSPTLSICSGRC